MDYTLPNEDGKPYDFADPEFWESYGAESAAALCFARGFPRYWRDVAGWYSMPGRHERAASNWRQDHYWKLASLIEIPLFTEEALGIEQLIFNEKHLRKFVSDKGAESNRKLARRRGYKVGSLGNSHVSCGPHAYILDDYFDRTKDFSLDLWVAIARTYVDALINANISPRSIRSGLKLRERLLDGAEYLGRTRLGHQEILEVSSSGSIRWGPLLYDCRDATKLHFLVVGMPRSGKTTLLRLLIQSLHRERKTRCIVYDFKTDLIPALKPPGIDSFTSYYHLLNPYDSRSSAWDVAKDVDDSSAETLASILMGTEQQGGDKYFKRIPRNILSATVRALISKAGNKWTLLDLMLAIQSENIRSVLAATPEGRRVYNTNIKGGGESGTQQNVISELHDCSQRYLRIASAWSRCSKKLSLREWALNDSKGIVLGNSIRNSASIKPVIRAIIHFLFYELLDNTAKKPHHTFMVLDEFSRLGLLPQISDVMEAAPSQGLSLALGIHDLETVKSVYGQSATAILGACGMRAYLRNENPETVRWLSRQFGDQDVLIERESSSQSESESLAETEGEEARRSQGSTLGRSKQQITRSAVSPECFMQLPLADAYDGITGYFAGPDHPPYRGVLNDEVFSTGTKSDEDGTAVRNYFLWHCDEDERECEFLATPPEMFSPPEDTFSTLEALGFEYDPDPHSKPLPTERPKAQSKTDANNGSPASPEIRPEVPDSNIEHAPHASVDMTKQERKNPPLSDCVWDDELQNWRLKTDSD